MRLLLLVAVGPLAAWGFGPFSSGGTSSLRGDGGSGATVAGGRRGGWVPPALRPVVRVRTDCLTWIDVYMCACWGIVVKAACHVSSLSTIQELDAAAVRDPR